MLLQRLKDLLGSIVDWFTKSAAGAGSRVAEVRRIEQGARGRDSGRREGDLRCWGSWAPRLRDLPVPADEERRRAARSACARAPFGRGHRMARRQRLRAAGPARDARLLASATRPTGRREQPRRRSGAAAVAGGPFASASTCGALRARPGEAARGLGYAARQHRRRDRRAGGAGRDLQDLRPLHGARDLLDQARRDPAVDRERARRPAWRPTASRCAAC